MSRKRPREETMSTTVSHQNSVNGESASCSREDSPVHVVSIDIRKNYDNKDK